MKPLFTILLICASMHICAQADSTKQAQQNLLNTADSQKINTQKDSTTNKVDTGEKISPLATPLKNDSFDLSVDTSFFSSDTASVSSLKKDSIITAAIPIYSKPLSWQADTAFRRLLLLSVSATKKDSPIILQAGELHQRTNMDALFYAVAGIVLFLAFIRQAFPKYFQNIFNLLIQPSFRQKQTREQLLQNNLPSLMMNLFFIITGGLFIALLGVQYRWVAIPFWWLALYCTVILACVYLAKFLVISFAGWVSNSMEAASTYSFIVFLINKILGLILLPIVILMAFADENIRNISVTVAACIAAFLLFYRYAVSLTIIRRNLKISPLHFFIYLCAVEIMPMLVIYKVLFSQTGKVIHY